MRGSPCAGLSLARTTPRRRKRQTLEGVMIVAIPFLILTSRHSRFAHFIARVGRLQSRIGSRMRVFLDSRVARRSSPKPNALAPTFRFRSWALTGAWGSDRSHSRPPQRDDLLLSRRDEQHGCARGYRLGATATQREKSGGAARSLDGEGPMSLRVAIRACRRAQALNAEVGQASPRLAKGAKGAKSAR